MKLDIKKERSEELLEKRILLLSFLAGVGFVIVELILSLIHILSFLQPFLRSLCQLHKSQRQTHGQMLLRLMQLAK